MTAENNPLYLIYPLLSPVLNFQEHPKDMITLVSKQNTPMFLKGMIEYRRRCIFWHSDLQYKVTEQFYLMAESKTTILDDPFIFPLTSTTLEMCFTHWPLIYRINFNCRVKEFKVFYNAQFLELFIYYWLGKITTNTGIFPFSLFKLLKKESFWSLLRMKEERGR